MVLIWGIHLEYYFLSLCYIVFDITSDPIPFLFPSWLAFLNLSSCTLKKMCLGFFFFFLWRIYLFFFQKESNSVSWPYCQSSYNNLSPLFSNIFCLKPLTILFNFSLILIYGWACSVKHDYQMQQTLVIFFLLLTFKE